MNESGSSKNTSTPAFLQKTVPYSTAYATSGADTHRTGRHACMAAIHCGRSQLSVMASGELNDRPGSELKLLFVACLWQSRKHAA